jgi:hypothetical protein
LSSSSVYSAGRDGTTFRRAEFSDAIVRGPARRRTPTEEGTTFDGPAGTTSIAPSSLGTSKNIHIKIFSRVRQRDGGLSLSLVCVYRENKNDVDI